MTDQIKHLYLGDLTVKRGEDGTLRVKGLATDDTLDLDQQICDPAWLAKAMPAWMEIGNIREMHQSKAVGKAMEMEQTGSGFIVEAKIVDKEAAMKVEEGIYTGFSIGIKGARVVKDAKAPGGRIVDGVVCEVSLVDRPANPSAVIEIAKSVSGELVKGDAVDENKFAATPAMNADAVMSEVPINPDVDEPRADNFQPCTVCGGSGHKSNIDANALTEIRCERCGGSGREPEGEHEQILQDSPTNPSIADDINHEMKGAEGEVEKTPATIIDLKAAIADESAVIEKLKALGIDLTKADDMKHDPAALVAVRASMIALIKAELDEMLAGDENEMKDVSQLLCSLKIFLDWWTDEASENETDAPFTGWDNDMKDDNMAYIGLGVSPDIIKAAVAQEATDADKTALRDEIRKALGVDEEIATYKAALEDMAKSVTTLTADLSAIREMAAPGGPALRQTTAQSNKSAQVEALKVEAERRRFMASQVNEPGLRNAYLDAASRLDAQAADLA